MATRPRAYFKGSIHHLVSRTVERKFLTRPDPWVTQNFLYLLALLAPKYRIQIHAYCLSTNHYHLLVTDTQGDQIPHFMREFNSLFARSSNAQRARTGYFWEGRYRDCEVAPHFQDVLRALVYISTNPVKDGLVPYARRWEGASMLPEDCGNTLRVRRPQMHFYAKTQLPSEVTLETALPRCMEPRHPDQLRKAWIEQHAHTERRMRSEFQGKKRTFLGMKRILRQSWDATPRSSTQIGEVIPTLQCSNVRERVAWLLWRKEREHSYRAALMAFKEGARDTVFPIGTWFRHIMDGLRRRKAILSFWEMYAQAP